MKSPKSSQPGVAEKVVNVNGIDIAYLEAGAGPTVLLAHGFPDDAWTWSNQIPALVHEGFRILAPFLRGYPPSQVPQDRSVSSKANSDDLAAFLQAVTDDPCHVVGHDWGGLGAHALTATAPELVRSAIVIAVSHPATLLRILEMPEVVSHLFHIWFFQLDAAPQAVRANELAMIDFLWDHWTADGHDDSAHVSRLKREVFAKDGVVEALLAYYDALVHLPEREPEFVADLVRPTQRPTLSIWGSADPARAAADGEAGFFQGGYRHEVVDGAGHFVHREQPAQFNHLMLGWLAEHETALDIPADSTV